MFELKQEGEKRDCAGNKVADNQKLVEGEQRSKTEQDKASGSERDERAL